MDYLTVRETAETWNLSLRTVQQLCAQGRIPGAKKFGKFWAIPAGAAKPQVSQQDQLLAEGPSAPGGQLDAANLMPLINTSFLPGRCRAAVEAMAPGPRRDIALAEYHYFTGHPEEAAQEAQPYLDSDDVGARLSACLVYAYANLSIGEICRAKFALGELSTSLAAAGGEIPPSSRQPRPLWQRRGRCSSTSPCRRGCRIPRTSSPFCLRGCGPSPCISRPTTST